MARLCTICTHPKRTEIDHALLGAQASFRTIADRFGLSQTALKRHKQDHLPAALVRAQDAAEVACADDLLSQVRDLQSKALGILGKAERAGELRTALAAIHQGRECVALTAKMLAFMAEQAAAERREQAGRGGGGIEWDRITVVLRDDGDTLRELIQERLAAWPEARDVALSLLHEDAQK